MAQAGLDESVIIAKIQHSSTAFDISTQGLVELKKAGVPQDVVKVMIERPQGPPAAPAMVAPASAPAPTIKPVKPFADITSVYIKAPSEVMRSTAEKTLREKKGPASSPSETEADATMIIGSDCGAQTLSLWSGANYCTCEGSLTIEINGSRLWSITDQERSANAAKASREMVERMTAKFVDTMRKAKKG